MGAAPEAAAPERRWEAFEPPAPFSSFALADTGGSNAPSVPPKRSSLSFITCGPSCFGALSSRYSKLRPAVPSSGDLRCTKNTRSKTKTPGTEVPRVLEWGSLAMFYFHRKYNRLSSTLRRFTVLFGMGRSGATSLWSPDKTLNFVRNRNEAGCAAHRFLKFSPTGRKASRL